MKREIKILLYGSNIWYFGEGMFAPLLAVYTEQIGGNILDISWAWSIYLIIYGVLSILIGRISDKVSKEKLMIAGYSLNALFTFGYLFIDSPAELFLLQAGLGVAAALATPTWDALYNEHTSKKNDGTVWGLADGTPKIITGIAIVIGALVIKHTSFQTLFLIMGCIQIIGTIIQAFILKKPKTAS